MGEGVLEGRMGEGARGAGGGLASLGAGGRGGACLPGEAAETTARSRITLRTLQPLVIGENALKCEYVFLAHTTQEPLKP